jgi:glycosyltransferase involved in cell wall biosynthesis
MRIAIVYPSLRAVGGAENVVVWLAESLAQRGHHVFLFTREFSESVWGPVWSRPYTVCILDFKKQRSTLKTNRNAGIALHRALSLSLYEFDVINPHSYPASLWVYYAKQQNRNFPGVLLYLHNLTRNFYEKLIDIHYRRLSGISSIWNRYRPKKLLRQMRQSIFNYRGLDKAAVLSCDKVLANSKYAAELASKIYNVEVLPCPLGVKLRGVSMPFDRRTSESEQHDGVFSIVTVARMERQKNIDTILTAIRLLKERNALPQRFRYILAGSGPHLENLMKRSRTLGIADIVTFVGSVPHEKVWKLYEDSAFLVHVPLDEPFGLVPLEAALLKKPSIVSNHGGPADIVVNGETGYQVDALNVEDIAEKIEGLIRHPERVLEMGSAAYRRVLEGMTWDDFVERFEKRTKEVYGLHPVTSDVTATCGSDR